MRASICAESIGAVPEMMYADIHIARDPLCGIPLHRQLAWTYAYMGIKNTRYPYTVSGRVFLMPPMGIRAIGHPRPRTRADGVPPPFAYLRGAPHPLGFTATNHSIA